MTKPNRKSPIETALRKFLNELEDSIVAYWPDSPGIRERLLTITEKLMEKRGYKKAGEK